MILLILFLFALVVVIEFLIYRWQKLLLKKAKASLNVQDYLHFKLDYLTTKSFFSDQLVKKAEIEEEARKLLDRDQYRKFGNEIDDKHIKISQKIISRDIYGRILPLINVLISLDQLIFGHQSFKDHPTRYRLIAIIILAVICIFYLFSILSRTIVLFSF